MAPTTTAVCQACNEKVTKTTGGVCCYICNNWFHRNDCSQVTEGAFSLLAKNKTIRWRCKECSAFSLIHDEEKIWKAVEQLTSKLDNLIQTLPTTIKKEIDGSLSTIKQEIDSSLSIIKDVVESEKRKHDEFQATVSRRFDIIEREIHKTRQQQCRNDILVYGLPSTVEPSQMALNISKAVGVNLNIGDVDCCFWLGRSKKTLLIKFCSAIKRDEVMKKYLSKKNLKLNQVVPTEIESRLYLNDNLAPAAVKAKNMCRSLMKRKEIKSFRLVPSIPAANVTYNNGTKYFCSLNDLSALVRDCEEGSNVIRRRLYRRSNGQSTVPNDTPTFGTPHLI